MISALRASKKLMALTVAAMLTTTVSLPAKAVPPADLDARIAGLMSQTGVPGAAIAIVENGQVVTARGYGVRRLGSADRVDENTIFQIGSCTKAITTAALSVLVDRGKLKWDDHVIDYMPEFQMYDPWVTREMTVRDLLVHRSGLGLGAGDLMFVPHTTFTRDDIVRRLRFIRPATSFRSDYAYDNVLYIAAGRLIERVSGQSWESFVKENVLTPAGMASATTGNDERFRVRNRALPHARINGPLRGLGDETPLNETAVALSSNMGPAGAISASARDMSRWLLTQLGHGATPEGVHVFSAASSAEMWTPRVLMPVRALPAPVADAAPQFNAYALGWDVRDYRGHRIIEHSGAVFGSQADVVLIPELNVGFAVLMNSEDDVFLRAAVFELLDHYLGFAARDWGAAWGAVEHDQQREALAAVNAPANAPAAVGPSLPLSRYAGEYTDAWYGRVRVAQTASGLSLDFLQSPGMTGQLTHWQYDTFKVTWSDPSYEPAFITFGMDADGSIDRVTMRAVSPLADFSWDYQDLHFTPAPGH